MTETMTLLPSVRRYVLEREIPIPTWRADQTARRRFRAAVAQAIVELQMDRRLDGRLSAVATQIAGMMTGVGVIEPLLDEPDAEEIIVRQGFVQLERQGRIEDVGPLADDGHFERVARRAADLGQRTMKGDRPYVLVDLPDGSRFTAIVPPLSVRGTAINVRVFARQALSLADLAGFGAFEEPKPSADRLQSTAADGDVALLPPVAQVLARVARGNQASVLISGEFGAGKTTLLNAMSLCVPPTVQLAVVETFEELKIAHPHALRVVVPEDRPDFPGMDEVLNVVITRMRPDLVIVGEIVRNEAPRFLDAINLGKKAWSTIHGNDALGALFRLETKALRSGLPHRAVREQIAAGVDLVVHLRQDPHTGARYVAQVAGVRGLTDGAYDLEMLYGQPGRGDRALAELWKEAHDD